MAKRKGQIRFTPNNSDHNQAVGEVSGPAGYDEAIMAELLDKPEIKAQVAQMTPETLAWFKELLVSQGIYAKFVKERKAK